MYSADLSTSDAEGAGEQERLYMRYACVKRYKNFKRKRFLRSTRTAQTTKSFHRVGRRLFAITTSKMHEKPIKKCHDRSSL